MLFRFNHNFKSPIGKLIISGVRKIRNQLSRTKFNIDYMVSTETIRQRLSYINFFVYQLKYRTNFFLRITVF